MLVLFSKEILWLQICTGSEVRIVLYNWFVYSEAFSDNRIIEVYVSSVYHWIYFQIRLWNLFYWNATIIQLLGTTQILRTIDLLYNKIFNFSSTHQPLMPNIKCCVESAMCSMFVFICIWDCSYWWWVRYYGCF